MIVKNSASISTSPFGSVGGKQVDLHAMSNIGGLTLKVSTYGGIVTNMFVPDRNGLLADIVLGFDDVAGYLKHSPYFGATVGRVGNRIRDARFSLDSQTYELAANDKPHHLHGGNMGWDKVVWTAEPLTSPDGPVLKLTYLSPDGEEGYPGAVRATTIYKLTNKNELIVDMSATSDRKTIVNMVHHTYWNLGGPRADSIEEHQLLLHADRYTPGDPVVPVGVEVPVRGTPFDFTSGKRIGQDLRAAGGDPVGYDHNFVVNGPPDQLRPVARLSDPNSGRVMTLEADQPGVQFYSGNFLDGKISGKQGVPYALHTGLCLETQKYPNAVNVPAWRGQMVLKPGQTYKHTMIHRFTAE